MHDAGLTGSLQAMSLPDVLQWIQQGGKTGILHVRSPAGVLKRVFVKEGAVWSSSSSEPREHLGQIMICRGMITESQLQKAMEEHRLTGERLGQILLRDRIVERPALVKTLRLKAQETLFSLFLWPEGDFHFEDREGIDESLVPISLSLQSIVMEGVKRVDEWARIRKVIPSGRWIPEKAPVPPVLQESLLPALALSAYAAVDGEMCLDEIALHLHATEFEMARAFYELAAKRLIKGGRIKPSPEDEMASTVHDLMVSMAEAAFKGERYAEAETYYQYLLRNRPSDAGIIRALEETREASSWKFFRETVPPNAVLQLAVPVSRLMDYPLTPEEGYMASRIDGAWTLSAILQVSPLSESEALHAVRRLLEKELIRVKRR